MKVSIFLFKSIQFAEQTGRCNFGGQVKDDGFIRFDIRMHEVGEYLNFFQTSTAAVALIGNGSIREAVAENPFTSF